MMDLMDLMDLMDWWQTLESKGYLQVNNFLDIQQANRLQRKLMKANHFRTWKLMTAPKPSLGQFYNRKQVKKSHQLARLWAKRNQFAYSFYRTSNKHADKHQKTALYQNFCQQLQDTVNQPLGLVGNVTDCFAAKFEREQFIGYHADKGMGKYAFIYQLSKGWQPKDGGQLVLYPKQGRFYQKVLLPKFNTLTLLKLDHPMYHSVSYVTAPKQKTRLTISGWLS